MEVPPIHPYSSSIQLLDCIHQQKAALVPAPLTICSIQTLHNGKLCKAIYTIIYLSIENDLIHSHRVGPLPTSPGMSVTSQFSSNDFNTANYQFITYTNGFYPVVKLITATCFYIHYSLIPLGPSSN